MNFDDVVKTPTGQAFQLRLYLINKELCVIIGRYYPQEAAVEKLFFSKNVTIAFGVALARGVALLTLVQSGLIIAEYTPGEVKMAVIGYGAARKEQVGYMVQHMLGLPSIPRPDDAADAAAIAICHAHMFHLLPTHFGK